MPRTRQKAPLEITLSAALITLSGVIGAPAAWAVPFTIASAPSFDPQRGDVSFFVGGITESGRALHPSAIEIVVDGVRLGPPLSAASLGELGAAEEDGRAAGSSVKAAKPPLAVGLVYLWVDGVPPGVLDGVHSFFSRLPPRTPVLPTIYGRLRQGRARLPAANISRLDEAPVLPGDRPNMVAAVRLDLADLASEATPLKVLLLVTDGRDFADPGGDRPGDLLALGEDIRRAGVRLIMVSFPAPSADGPQAATNLRDLMDAAGAFYRPVDRPEELDNVLESLGQAVGDMQLLRFTPPFGWKTSGSARRVGARLQVDGRTLTVEAGKMALPTSGALVWVLLGVGGVAVIGGGLVFFLRRTPSAPPSRSVRSAPRRPRLYAPDDETDDDDHTDEASGPELPDDLVRAVHDLVRRGTPAARAVVALGRKFPSSVGLLMEAGPEIFSDARAPSLRTRAGRARLAEIQALLRQEAEGGAGGLDPGLVEILVAGLSDAQPATAIAKSIAARLADEVWSPFARMPLESLSEVQRALAAQQPELGRPKVRGELLAVQDALRAEEGPAIAVAWLVGATGLGVRRGATLRLSPERSVLGRGVGCDVRLDDPGVADTHASIVANRGEYTLEPIGGAVTVETEPVTRPRRLADGDTIQVGGTQLVFKVAGSAALFQGS